MAKYALFWHGKRLPNMTFSSKQAAVTARSLETQQMELAEYSPKHLQRYFKVKAVGKK